LALDSPTARHYRGLRHPSDWRKPLHNVYCYQLDGGLEVLLIHANEIAGSNQFESQALEFAMIPNFLGLPAGRVPILHRR